MSGAKIITCKRLCPQQKINEEWKIGGGYVNISIYLVINIDQTVGILHIYRDIDGEVLYSLGGLGEVL